MTTQDVIEDNKKKREQDALAHHERMSRLFMENRFQFELERKKLIADFINLTSDEAKKRELQDCQDRWDSILKNSGSTHNRFVLIQMLFWQEVNERFRPWLNHFRSIETNSSEEFNPTIRKE